MPTWTPEQLRDYERKFHTKSPRTNPVLEHASSNEPLAQDQGQEGGSGKLLVRFESVRKRLCDPDNLSVKWLLDSLRYTNAIQGDEPEKIELQVTQRKCRKGEEEFTVIQVSKL